MELSLITVAFDPQRRAFPRAPLAAVKGEILNVVEHWTTGRKVRRPSETSVKNCRYRWRCVSEGDRADRMALQV